MSSYYQNMQGYHDMNGSKNNSSNNLLSLKNYQQESASKTLLK